MMPKRLLQLWQATPNWLKFFATLISGMLIIPAWSGFVGNRFDAIALTLPGFLEQTVSVKTWQLALASLLLLGFPLVWFLYVWLLQTEATDKAVSINKLDDSLLRLLSEKTAAPQDTPRLDVIVDELLRDTLDLLGQEATRISVLRPDPARGGALAMWRTARVPIETVQRTVFPLTSPAPTFRPGVAAKVFLSPQVRVVHMLERNGQWLADDEDYIFFDPRRKPGYRSFICLPVLDAAGEPIAVLCVDSPNNSTFDKEQIQELLSTIAERLAAAMLIA
ncbi:GAF domain-containing protein [Gloeobacter morelensis]|uniref:GAF domain-containing protein n=1 Tax=Gloeobacter morelensis MG652769 TaxID=2781736 RepID=A0ABY3PLA7_9CYAN|nr:GAF domain-containing protein [Gloeobacter morelensis]UFP94471.1 GAF domain-containing protein [Gloeobacter morelensis MG652769]